MSPDWSCEWQGGAGCSARLFWPRQPPSSHSQESQELSGAGGRGPAPDTPPLGQAGLWQWVWPRLPRPAVTLVWRVKRSFVKLRPKMNWQVSNGGERHSSEGYFENSIPLLSEHKQHLAFIAKNVCIGGPAWGWCDHYESFELDICFQMKANPLTRWDHIISQSGEFRLLRFKSLAILVCTSLKA